MKYAWLKLLAVLTLACTCAMAGSHQWNVLGPDGGDVRSLAYDPHNPNRIFLGTSTGVIFVSDDDGHNWSRFAKLGAGDDYELVFAAPAKAEKRIAALSKKLKLALTPIGRFEKGSGVHVLDAEGRPAALPQTGYRHF